MTVAIGARRGDAAAESIQQLLCDRMIGHADCDSVLAAGDDVVDGGRALRDQRQRTGPERVGELLRFRRHLAHPALQVARMIDVHDHRMRRRPVLGAEDLAHGVGVVGVRAEAVDGFRRKRDQLAGTQRFDSLLDLLLQYPSDRHRG